MWFGTINDVDSIIKYAHKNGAITIVDASQSIPHFRIDVQVLNTDFFEEENLKGQRSMGVLCF